MKNKTKKDSIFNKKGFYTALYSCIGVMLVLAAGISFYNINWVSRNEPMPAPTPTQTPFTINMSELEQTTISSMVDSYQASKEKDSVPQYETVENEPDPYEAYDWNMSWRTETQLPMPQAKVQQPAESIDTKNEVVSSDAVTTLPDDYDPSLSIFNQDGNRIAQAEPLAKPVFSYFTSEDTMSWPLLGEVVMDYSVTTGVFDTTLDKYRTNDGICIAAPAGTQVRASADGIVTSISKTFSDGNVIVIDNGNGWTTTYSQLQDGMLVKEGDVVKAGDVIGGVGSPSIYYVLMGNHLSFKVSKNDQTVDPMTILNK